jgi:hypothetical protein
MTNTKIVAGSMTTPPSLSLSGFGLMYRGSSIDTVRDAMERGNGRVLTATPSSEMSVIFEAQEPQSQKSSLRRRAAPSGWILTSVE